MRTCRILCITAGAGFCASTIAGFDCIELSLDEQRTFAVGHFCTYIIRHIRPASVQSLQGLCDLPKEGLGERLVTRTCLWPQKVSQSCTFSHSGQAISSCWDSVPGSFSSFIPHPERLRKAFKGLKGRSLAWHSEFQVGLHQIARPMSKPPSIRNGLVTAKTHKKAEKQFMGLCSNITRSQRQSVDEMGQVDVVTRFCCTQYVYYTCIMYGLYICLCDVACMYAM